MHATLDEVLDILHRTGPDLVNGNSNHGPMAAEALFALDRPDAVLPWIERWSLSRRTCVAFIAQQRLIWH